MQEAKLPAQNKFYIELDLGTDHIHRLKYIRKAKGTLVKLYQIPLKQMVPIKSL